MRVSQSSQHPSRTWPSATPRLVLSAPTLGSRSLSHPLPEPIPEGGRGREGLVFLFNRGERNRPFVEPQTHKESGGMIRSATASPGSPGACAARGWKLQPAMCAAQAARRAAALSRLVQGVLGVGKLKCVC